MPELDPVDWYEVERAMLDVAQLVKTYHQTLQANGFGETEALALTLAYQEHLLGAVDRRP